METTPRASLSDAHLAESLLRHSGNLAFNIRARGLGALQDGARKKSNIADVVTEADLAAEKYVFEQLRQCRPEDSILGEEGCSYSGSSGRIWVIDPVDGTYNFFSGSSYWCSALALCLNVTHDGGDSIEGADPLLDPLLDAEPLLGAVYQPQEDKLWIGGSAQEATLNGVPIRVDARWEISQLSAGTYIHPQSLGNPAAAGPWQRAAQLPATLRMLGSGSCDLSRVAQGELGVWFQHSRPAWDWLPGKAIVKAAGGDSCVVAVNGLNWFVAGPAGAVAQLRDALLG